jgi:hypothetical protein
MRYFIAIALVCLLFNRGYSQCQLNVSKTNVTCSGENNGSVTATVTGASVPNHCVSPTPSSVNCSSGCTSTITNTGTHIKADNGNVVCVTVDNFQGVINLNQGGTVIICGNNAIPKSVVFNGGTLIVNSNLTFDIVQILSNTSTISNFGAITFLRAFSSDLNFLNNGTVNLNSVNFTVGTNSQSFNNYGTITISSANFINNQVATNYGTINVSGGQFQNTSTFTNNCTLNSTSFINSGNFSNKGNVKVTASFTHSSGTLSTDAFSQITTSTFVSSAAINGTGSTCSLIKVLTSASLQAGTVFSGQATLCSPSTSNTAGVPASFLNCNCNVNIPAYTYTWKNASNVQVGGNTNAINNLTSGTYSVTVNATGCQALNANITVSQPVSLGFTFTKTDVACINGATGNITISATGGTAPYQFSKDNGSTYQTSNTFSGLTAGTFQLLVKDANNCVSTAQPVTISQPTALSFTTSKIDESCNEGSTGSITVSATGGTTPYQYSKDNGVTYQAAAIFNTLSSDAFQVVVKDANNCVTPSQSVTITQPTALSFTTSKTDESCNGGSTGSITVSALGGTSPYQYSKDNGVTYQGGSIFNSVGIGSYQLVVKDANNCIANVQSVTINQPSSITATVTKMDENCNGGSTGSITVVVTGGTSPYQFSKDNGVTYQTSNVFNSVATGSYQLVVKDTNNCTSTAQTVTINQPTSLSVTVTKTDEGCKGGNTGSITLTTTGGTSPYQYSKDNGTTFQTSSIFNGLTAGTYQVIVKDSNNCTSQLQTVTIQDGVPLSFTFTKQDDKCNGTPSGSIVFTASGGNGVYQYSVNNGVTYQSSNVISNLTAGKYQLVVKDTNNCTSASQAVKISQPVAINVTVTKVDQVCFGGSSGSITIAANGGFGNYLYSIDNGISYQTTNTFNNLTAGTYQVIVMDGNACFSVPQTITIEQPREIIVTATTTNIDCYGNKNGSLNLSASGGSGSYSYSINNGGSFLSTTSYTGLGPDTFNVIVKDTLGCLSSMKTVIVTQPDLLRGIPNVTNASCYGGKGSISLNIVGGSAPFTTLWTNDTTNQNLSSVPAGAYSVYITDAHQCKADTIANVQQPAVLRITPKVKNVSALGQSDGAVTLSVNGGTPGYTYSWNNQSTNQNLTNLTPGEYTVTVTDGNSCSVTVDVTVNGPQSSTNFGGTTILSSSPCDAKREKLLPGTAVGTTDSIAIPGNFVLPKKAHSAVFNVKMDLGDDYIFGDASTNGFNGQITFTVAAKDPVGNSVAGIFKNNSYTINLNNSNPEAVFLKDFTSNADVNGNFLFTNFRITITGVNFTFENNVPSNIRNMIKNSLRVKLAYEIDYGFDVANAAPVITNPMVNQNISGTREVVFSWDPAGQEFCNYQFQLLRLYNIADATSTDEHTITAEVDWSKALLIETESADTTLKLTVAEGQGYYLWRVRPIGTYYPGGIANALNLNNNLWSQAPGDGLTLAISSSSLSNYTTLFFLNDPDDQLNRIYSRTFTEGNKISETSTYANGLQQIKQSQTYLPSKDTTLVTQHVQDLSGRPSLTTLPAPTDSSMYKGYKSGFFTKTDGSIYTGKDIDTDVNFDKPPQTNQSNGAFQYYSNQNNNDPNVPDAQGFPFQRTQFFNDGTGREKQESGVGKKNMIGNGTASSPEGEGKTVKTYYGTPSDQELIQLFGDEAPSCDKVFKTITIDQNNTATVTLTNREGHVIATSLAFQDPKDQMTTVNDKVVKNVKTASGFISSKRLALLQSTPLVIGYNLKCDPMRLPCNNANVDCGFTLKVIIFNLDNNTNQTIINQPLSSVPCNYVDSLKGNYQSVTPVTVNLSPGNYIIEKVLIPGTITTAVTAAQDKIEKQVGPITSLVEGWLQNVKCPAQLNTFFDNLRNLSSSINSGSVEDLPAPAFPYQFTDSFKVLYYSNPSAFHLDIRPRTGTPRQMTLTTPCCSSINVPIDWTPPFNCPPVPKLVDKNGNGVLEVRPYSQASNPDSLNDPTEFFPDFEGYARVFLGDCYDSATFYSQYMEGWKPGEFNLMIYHMLTDQYNCTNNFPGQKVQSTSDSLQSIKGDILDECGNKIGSYSTAGVSTGCTTKTISIEGVSSQVSACTQYTCNELFSCWLNQLAALRSKICVSISYSDNSDHVVSNNIDGQNGGNQGTFDDGIDKNMKGGGFFFIRWLAKSKLHKKLRGLEAGGTSADIQPTYDHHLVQDFLGCTGYRFAKILTQYDPNPLVEDQATGINYTVAAVNDTSLLSTAKKTNGDYFYIPFSNWTPGVTNPNGNPNLRTTKGYFPFIKNPIYAFKYFEYPYEADSTYQDLEALTCYSDPNDCYKTFSSDGSTPSVKIPCCVTINTDGSYNLSGCYKDYKYPNIDKLPLDPDPAHPTNGILSDDGGKYKLLVDEFCGSGRLKCEYTKDFWSCGQRFTFYQALKTYQVPTADYLSIYPVRDCDFVKTDYVWYNNPAPDSNTFPDLVTAGERDAIMNAFPGKYTTDQFTQAPSMLNLSGQVVSQISYVEMQMVQIQQNCLGTCEGRRKDIENNLRQVLESRCYVIGACKSNSDYVQDNMIPLEDFNAMVDNIIGQCKSQCTTNTYKCVPPQMCRKIKTPKIFLGNNFEIVDVEFGSGGLATDACTLVSGEDYYDCSGTADSNLSFCQYTKVQQATTWEIEIDLPSACPDNKGGKVLDCTPGNTTCVPKSLYETDATNAPPNVYSGAVPVKVTVDK